MFVREYNESDLLAMTKIWNEVVEDGVAFPQEELLTIDSAASFFASQNRTAVACADDGSVCGLYILHPNNIGRCGHICNASFAVNSRFRGLHIGEGLVNDCLASAKALGFSIMQFNAVVESNIHARHLYERLGFVSIGQIPNGFRMKDGHYETIYLYYHLL